MVRKSRTFRPVAAIGLAAVAAGCVVAGSAAKPSAADASQLPPTGSATDPAPSGPADRGGQTAVGYLAVRGLGEQPEPGRTPVPTSPDELAILQETYARTLAQESLFTEAISNPASKIRATAWFKGFEAEADPMGARRRSLARGLVVAAVPRSHLIRVSMTAPSADDARVVAQELGDALVAKVSADRRDEDRRQIELMAKQQKLLENELEQEVVVQMRAKEQDLGENGVDPAGAYNEKLTRFRALQQANDQIVQTVAGFQAEMQELDGAQRDGRTLPDVRDAAERDARWVAAQTRVDDADLRIAEMEVTVAKDDPKLAAARKVRTVGQQKADQIREELLTRTFEARRAEAARKLLAANANRAVITEYLAKLGKELGRANSVSAEYAVLRQRERRLRDRADALEADIRRVREFRLAVPWSPLHWSSAPALQP